MTVETELRQARDLFDGVALLRRAAAELDGSSSTREELLAYAERRLTEAGPVRVSVAARLLGMDEKTVRKWTRRGLFEQTPTSGYQRLDVPRLHEVWDFVRRLREAKKVAGLLDQVWWRLQDEAWLHNPDFREGYAQYLRGEYEIVRPRPETLPRGDDGGADGPGQADRGAPTRPPRSRV
jgi:hypothetical protein